LGGLLAVAACRKKNTPDQSMADMPGMAGASQAADTSGVPIDRSEAARLGITFARASERPITTSVRAVGVLKYAEPRQAYVNARVNGWVEKLYADYVGKSVSAGEPLLALYSPDLVSAQEEYLLARRLRDDTLAASARRRLTLWDIPRPRDFHLSPARREDTYAHGARRSRQLVRRAPTGDVRDSGALPRRTACGQRAPHGGAADRNEGPGVRQSRRRPVRAA